MSRQTTLLQLRPRCEACGVEAPPAHDSPRRGAFAAVRERAKPGAEPSLGALWLCDPCWHAHAPAGVVQLTAVLRQRVVESRAAGSDPRHMVVSAPAGSGGAERGAGPPADGGRRGTRKPRADGPTAEDASIVTPVVGPSLDVERLAALHLLTSVQGLGPVAALEVYRRNLSPEDILARPERYPLQGKRADQVIAGIRAITAADRDVARAFAQTQVERAKALGVLIMTYDHPHYPPLVKESNDPQPILWVRGASEMLAGRDAVACVGSRGLRDPYKTLHADFARAAAAAGFAVVSGFALGADSEGHRAAFEAGGNTVCVMPCGVDLVFPPENRPLWRDLVRSGRAAIISEFPLGRRAESLTLKKRNKLIVAAARGVLVSQSAADGGAMNAYRFAVEQKKALATFAPDGTGETTGNVVVRDERSVRSTSFPLQASDAGSRYAKWLRAL